jgi:hypothetical protein
MKFLRQIVAWVLCYALLISTSASAAGTPASSAQGQAAQDANLTPKELDDLVAPIALYPDALVAQVLAAATYPDQIITANDWLKANSNLKDQALTQAVDKQPWDPGVKALTQFPSVLENMAKNLPWTSALGEASYYQQKDVMAAIQRLRKQAKAAGTLKSGEQIKVIQQDPQTIIIQPANPQVVYVPVYNPTVVYGVPYSPPGYSSADVAAAAIVSFGVGMMVGAAVSNSWGYGGWGCGWHGGSVMYQRNVYVSNSAVYRGGYRGGYYGGARPAAYNAGNINRGNVNTGNVNRANVNSGNRNTNINTGGNTVNINTGGSTTANRPSGSTRPATGAGGSSSREAWRNSSRQGGQASGANARPTASTADRGYGQRSPSTNSGAFSGYNKGGNARTDSSRGSSSFSGGGSGSRGGRSGGGGSRGGGRR